jgi:multidrug resistance efflux pump
MNKIFHAILVLGLAALAVIGMVKLWPRPPLDATLSSPNAPSARLVCYGYLDNRQGPILLQPARAGRVVQVFVKERQTVGKDSPLVQLDDNLVRLHEQEAVLAVQAAQLQLDKARDGIKQYQARLAQAEAALEAANSKALSAQYVLTRKEELVKLDLANHVEVDVGCAQLREANALVQVERNRLLELKAIDPALEVKQAQLQLARSQADLERTQQERGEYLLRAPAPGRVLRVQAQEGDLLSPAFPRPAVWLTPASDWIVRAEVSQEFAGYVTEGLDVQVEDEESTALLAKGRVADVADSFLPRRQVDARPTGTNTGMILECLIDLQDGHSPLRLGQRVRVRILADQSGPNDPRINNP